MSLEASPAGAVGFTAPYVVMEGLFAVPEDSGITALADIDREHVRIGVNEGSAYGLFLSRGLRRASVVRGQDGLGLFREQASSATRCAARTRTAPPRPRLTPAAPEPLPARPAA